MICAGDGQRSEELLKARSQLGCSVTIIWAGCAPRANFISPPSKATARPWSSIPNPKRSYWILALVYELESKTEDAIQTYQRLLQVNAQNAWARRRLGELYVGQNKLDEALRQFETLRRQRKPIRARRGSKSA